MYPYCSLVLLVFKGSTLLIDCYPRAHFSLTVITGVVNALSLILLFCHSLTDCSLRGDFGITFRLCPMNGGSSFHCIPDVDDDCISDSQVKTHGSLLFLNASLVQLLQIITMISTKLRGIYRDGRLLKQEFRHPFIFGVYGRQICVMESP